MKNQPHCYTVLVLDSSCSPSTRHALPEPLQQLQQASLIRPAARSPLTVAMATPTAGNQGTNSASLCSSLLLVKVPATEILSYLCDIMKEIRKVSANYLKFVRVLILGCP